MWKYATESALLSGGNVIIVIGGDDNKDEDEEECEVISRWAKRKVVSYSSSNCEVVHSLAKSILMAEIASSLLGTNNNE